jgi:hypothetical protein
MKRKFLVTIILLLLLLPFVSWYYLRSGLQWRKAAQDVMSGTTPFPDITLVDRDGKSWPAGTMSDRVSLVSFAPCTPDMAWDHLVALLYDQFKDTGKANFILLDSCAAQAADVDKSRKGTYQVDCAASGALCAQLAAEWPSGKAFALVDKHRVIRAYYPAGTNEEKRVLLEHMALLLPRERSEKVELKRGQEQ